MVSISHVVRKLLFILHLGNSKFHHFKKENILLFFFLGLLQERWFTEELFVNFFFLTGVFQKFVDADGKFKDSLGKDKRGLLNLYEAAHVRTYGDSILEEAHTFATTNLKTCGAQLVDSTLAKQVEHALKQPLHKGVPRLEIRHYISIYEEDE